MLLQWIPRWICFDCIQSYMDATYKNIWGSMLGEQLHGMYAWDWECPWLVCCWCCQDGNRNGLTACQNLASAASIDDIGITCDNEPSGFGKTLSTLVCFLILAHLTYQTYMPKVPYSNLKNKHFQIFHKLIFSKICYYMVLYGNGIIPHIELIRKHQCLHLYVCISGWCDSVRNKIFVNFRYLQCLCKIFSSKILAQKSVCVLVTLRLTMKHNRYRYYFYNM